MVGVLVGLVASIAIAPAPLGIPKMSRSALLYVSACFGERKSARDCTLPPAAGMNKSCPLADSVPALNSVSSVRHTEPPTPSVCAVTETSDRYGAYGFTVTDRCETLEE